MKWNKTSELLPEPNTFVLGWHEGLHFETEYCILEYYVADETDEGEWAAWYYLDNIVTPPDYWMPLPQKPE